MAFMDILGYACLAVMLIAVIVLILVAIAILVISGLAVISDIMNEFFGGEYGYDGN